MPRTQQNEAKLFSSRSSVRSFCMHQLSKVTMQHIISRSLFNGASLLTSLEHQQPLSIYTESDELQSVGVAVTLNGNETKLN